MNRTDTVVRASCPDCGTVDLPAAEVTVYLPTGAAEPCYRYLCPHCEAMVEKRLAAVAVDLLERAGAAVVRLPQEQLAAPAMQVDAISPDDVRAFLRALSRTDDVAAAARG